MGPSDRPLRGHRTTILIIFGHSPKPKIASRFSSPSIQENRRTGLSLEYLAFLLQSLAPSTPVLKKACSRVPPTTFPGGFI